jgi:hypothetical protein
VILANTVPPITANGNRQPEEPQFCPLEVKVFGSHTIYRYKHTTRPVTPPIGIAHKSCSGFSGGAITHRQRMPLLKMKRNMGIAVNPTLRLLSILDIPGSVSDKADISLDYFI